jgi:hypothetical protein
VYRQRLDTVGFHPEPAIVPGQLEQLHRRGTDIQSEKDVRLVLE